MAKCTKYKCDSDLEASWDAVPFDKEDRDRVILAKSWCGVCDWCKDDYEQVAMVAGFKFVPIVKNKSDWVRHVNGCRNCEHGTFMIGEPDIIEPARPIRCIKHNWKCWTTETCDDWKGKTC